jgi:hypothetical protein
MGPFNAGSLWPLLVGALGMYLLLGVGLDLAVQLLGPASARRCIWIRGGAVLAVALGLTLAAGEARSLPLLAVSALFAVSTPPSRAPRSRSAARRALPSR